MGRGPYRNDADSKSLTILHYTVRNGWTHFLLIDGGARFVRTVEIAPGCAAEGTVIEYQRGRVTAASSPKGRQVARLRAMLDAALWKNEANRIAEGKKPVYAKERRGQ